MFLLSNMVSKHNYGRDHMKGEIFNSETQKIVHIVIYNTHPHRWQVAVSFPFYHNPNLIWAKNQSAVSCLANHK